MFNNTILKDAKRICERVNLDVLNDSTILVTGASGLIGTYILSSLCCMREYGVKIKVYAQHLSELPEHVARLVIQGSFITVRTNLAEPDEYVHLPEVDIIIHAAGYAQPSRFMADPIATVQVNTSATIALLKKLRSDGRFLFVSTSEVYSGLDKQFLSENDIGLTTPYHPRAVYIEGKRCGETICNAMRTKGINAAIARVALAYGPGTRKNDKRALNSFIEKALFQRKIELLDAGTAKRTYCYVADTVELLWQILLYGREPVYNVGGHSTVTIAELATMIGKMVGVPVAFPATQAEISGAPKEVCLDLTRIEKEFGKTQYVGMEDGLRATIEWQRVLYM